MVEHHYRVRNLAGRTALGQLRHGGEGVLSGLPQQLEQVLRNILPTIPGVAGLRNFGDFDRLDENTKRQIYRAIATALLGNDQNTIAKALLDALIEGGSTVDWTSILRAWAGELIGSDPIKQDILKALTDGKLSTEEIVSILLKAAQSLIKEPAVRAVIDGIATIYNVPGAQRALEDYLNHSGFPDPGILQSIAAGKISPQAVLQVLAVWAAASDPAGFGSIISSLPDLKNGTATPEEIVLAVIGQRLPSNVQEILSKLLDSDWSGLLATILGTLNLGLGLKVLADVAAGKYRDAAIDQLVEWLKSAGVNEQHALPLINAFIDLVTGARSLFAAGPEPEAVDAGLSPDQIARWQEIRAVIYTAQLAINKGDLVPMDPQAEPHIFLAAKIRYNTFLHDLVSSKATDQQLKEFCDTLTAFLDVRFGDRMTRRFLTPPEEVVIAVPELRSDSPVTCASIYLKVTERLKPRTTGTIS